MEGFDWEIVDGHWHEDDELYDKAFIIYASNLGRNFESCLELARVWMDRVKNRKKAEDEHERR